MANDFINIIERSLIDELRAKFPNCSVYGQYPEAVNATWPAIILEMVGSGTEQKFMGEKVTFGSSNTSSTGEIYGVVYVVHLVIDKDSKLSVTQDDDSVVVYKGRRLLNYLMLNVANVLTDMGSATGGSWYTGTEVLQQDLNNWSDIGYDPALEMYGASAVYMIAFKNYR